MSYALTATISARARLEFQEKVDVTDGSFYMTAIEQEQVIMAASSSIEEVKKVFAASRKPIIPGTFWEVNLGYNWDDMASDNTVAVDVSGSLAFEVDDGETLQRYGVGGGPIETLLIAWAEDGDSPKKIPVPLDVEGELSDCNEDSEFEEFSG